MRRESGPSHAPLDRELPQFGDGRPCVPLRRRSATARGLALATRTKHECYSLHRLVRSGTRHGLALGSSVLLHGAIVGYALIQIVPDFDMPEIELEFTEVELLDPDALQTDEPVQEEAPPVTLPEPPPPSAETPETPEEDEGDQAKKEEEPEPEEPERSLGKRKSNVDKLAPATARTYMLIVPKKIRDLPFRETVVDVMAPFPDFEYLVEGGGFDPMRDFDHIVIASPDLRDWTQTFLAVDYKMSRDEVKASIDRAASANEHVIEWVEAQGILRGNPQPADGSRDRDPRSFLLLEDRVAVYVRDEFVDAIIGAGEEGAGADAKTLGNFVANLTKLRRFAARIPAAGLQLKWKDIHAALKRVRGLPFPLPDDFELTAEASEDPEVLVRLEFLSAQDAKNFQRFYENELAQVIDQNMALRFAVKSIYEATQTERNGKELRLWTELTTKQLETLLQVIAQQSARFQRLDQDELAKRRQQRQQRWDEREGGKLPPSALPTPNDDESTPSEPPEALTSPSHSAPPAGLRRDEL